MEDDKISDAGDSAGNGAPRTRDIRDSDPDEQPGGLGGWVSRHAEVVWGALCIVFLIYAATAFVNLQRGVFGPDDSNVIGVIGGIVAAIAAGIICVVTIVRKRRSREES